MPRGVYDRAKAKKRDPGGAIRCPKCGGFLRVRSASITEVGGVPATKRWRVCRACDFSIPTIELVLGSLALRNTVKRLRHANQERVAQAIATLVAGGEHD
jgi:hypothetical protein